MLLPCKEDHSGVARGDDVENDGLWWMQEENKGVAMVVVIVCNY